MNEIYFQEKIREIVDDCIQWGDQDVNWARFVEILKQIALDQREACIVAIGKFYDNWNRTHNEEEWSDADLFEAVRNAEIDK